MERMKHIKQSLVVPTLEHAALNARIDKARDWLQRRRSNSIPIRLVQTPSSTIVDNPGQLVVTILRAEDLHESRLLVVPIVERPYVIIECNQQRFRTKAADSISTNGNPQWTSNNGPFRFKISNSNNDRLTVWVQQHDALHAVKRNEPKMLGICDINVRRLLDQEQVWLPLRQDNKPAGQVLVQVNFYPDEK